MTRKLLWLLCGTPLLWCTVSLAVTPLSPRKPTNNANVDCTGPVAFSSTGGQFVHSTGLLSYRQNLVSLTVSWDREVGVFTCTCSGLYQFSFSGSTENNAKMVLQKRSNNGKQWSPVLATQPGGGSATILLDIDVGDQVAVFLDGSSKKLNARHEQGADVTSFSGHRIAKT